MRTKELEVLHHNEKSYKQNEKILHETLNISKYLKKKLCKDLTKSVNIFFGP